MAHYAFLDEDNIVTHVITGRDEDDHAGGITDWEEYYGNFHKQRCLRTSYNTYNNQHREGGTPFRGNYAGIGFIYLEEHDIFMPPKPYESWLLDLETASWAPPEPYPANEDGVEYIWDEETLNWIPNDGT
jgi:hypothetical protein